MAIRSRIAGGAGDSPASGRAKLAACRCAAREREQANRLLHQKKVVPSDLISSPLTTGMHGIELCDPERGALRLSAPLRTFSPFAESMPPGTPPAASLSGPDCSQRPFAHPQRVPPLGDLHSGVNVPGLPLRNPSRLASVPVRPFGSATALRFAPLTATSTPQARCTSTAWFG